MMKWDICLSRRLAWPNWAMGRPALSGSEAKTLAWWWWWWRYNVRWGRVSALRFHLCNLPSIVQDYYQLFNYSDDIYQGQLYRSMSCWENGLSVLLLHSQAEECAGVAVQVGAENLWLDSLLLRECSSHKSCYKLSGMISELALTCCVYIVVLP